MGLVSLSSFVGTVDADKNLVEQFKAEQKKKHPTLNFDEIKKLAIQAPEATEFSINGENFVMPSTGIFEPCHNTSCSYYASLPYGNTTTNNHIGCQPAIIFYSDRLRILKSIKAAIFSFPDITLLRQ